MGAPQRWSRFLVVVPLALLVFVGPPGSARGQGGGAPGVTISQCENRSNGTSINDCYGNAWVKGALDHNHSLYRMGDFVPFRTVMTSLTAGGRYTLDIGYDAVESGKHAYDYLGTYDASRFPNQEIDPCSGVAETAGTHQCGASPSVRAIPVDTHTTFPPALGGSQAPGDFSAWGAQLDDIVYTAPHTPIAVGTPDTVERHVQVTFTVATGGTSVVLAWGGHIASVLDWGEGRTYNSTNTGAPFHMRLGGQLCRVQPEPNCYTTGNQDLPLHAGALAPQPGLATSVVVPTPLVATDQTVTDIATLTSVSGNPVRGSVQFFVCFDATAAPPCAVGGTLIGQDTVVLATGSNNGTASVGFRADQAVGGQGPGHYCFRVEYTPSEDALYSPAKHTDLVTECFVATGTPEPPPLPATLEVEKVCDPPGDTGHFRVLIETASGHPVKRQVVACGGTTGAVPVDPGSYRVRERGANGTDLSNYTRVIGQDCNSDGSITIAEGENAKCVITNVRKGAPPSAQLTVTKLCVPPGDGGRFNLTIDGQTSPDMQCGQSFGPVIVAPGQHQVSESAGTGTSLSDYTTTIGGACAADGSITLAADQQATCTITNVRAGQGTGTIEIQKECSPPGTTGRFQLELDDQVFRGIPCGGSTGAVVIGVGDHRIGEVAVDSITRLFRTTISGSCSPSGTFTVSAGQHLTCVITNTRVPAKPVPRPPAACYRLTVVRRMVRVGSLVPVLAFVHLNGRPVQGIRVYAVGPGGVAAVLVTGPNGRVLFLLRLHTPGILRLTIRTPFECPAHPPQKVGVLGVSQPSLTG